MKAADINIILWEGCAALRTKCSTLNQHLETREEKPLTAKFSTFGHAEIKGIPADQRPRTDATSMIKTVTPALVSSATSDADSAEQAVLIVQ